MRKTDIITLVILGIFICGTGVIMYYGRPVMNIENTPEETSPAIEDEEEEEEETDEDDESGDEEEAEVKQNTEPAIPQASGTYTSAQVAEHAIESNCWASVDGDVYDLTSWVSRHPGGNKAIISLCGTDATARFEGKHGGSSAPKAALALLKIGTLVE